MKVLYINLDSDTESRDLTEAELARVGLKAERVSAVTGDNRPLAFNQSVYKAMEMAKGQLLLLEDDVVFTDTIPFLTRSAELPHDFMTLHLGANIIGMDTTVWQMPTPHSEHLAKLWNCWMSHATLYSAECVKFILDNLDPNRLDEDNNIFDDWLRRKVMPMGRSYVMKPMVAMQRPRKSAIWGGDHISDYTSVHKRGNEYLARL